MNISVEGAIKLVNSGKGVGAALFADAAAQMDAATTFWFGKSQGVISTKDREILVDSAVLNESALGSVIVRDKTLTKQLLAENGIRTPAGSSAMSTAEAVSIANKIGYPVVLKPSKGGHGKGVSVDIRTEAGVRDAFRRASEYTQGRILVEKHIFIQDEYRCMASDSSCVAVIQRKLPTIVGDGVSSIFELIRYKNHIRKLNPALHDLLIPVDVTAKETISRQGYVFEDILSRGIEITVRNVGGLSGGGEPHERSTSVSETFKKLAHRSVAAIPGLAWGGVDMVIEQGTQAPYVIEINTCAGYGAATFPLGGTPTDVASGAWLTRKKLTPPDGSPSKRLPRWRDTTSSTSVGATFGTLISRDLSTLSQLFLHWIQYVGYDVEQHGDVFRVPHSDGDHWFSHSMSSAQDLLAVRRILRRHTWVRTLLARKRVPRPRGKVLSNGPTLENFLKGLSGNAVATPANKHWGAAGTKILAPADANELPSQVHTWFVQSKPVAPRVRVYATRRRSLALTQPPGDLAVSDITLQQISKVAVAAVRAVPELRWAAIDLSLPTKTQNIDEGVTPLVEGISINPSISVHDMVVAGDLEDFFSYLIPAPEAWTTQT